MRQRVRPFLVNERELLDTVRVEEPHPVLYNLELIEILESMAFGIVYYVRAIRMGRYIVEGLAKKLQSHSHTLFYKSNLFLEDSIKKIHSKLYKPAFKLNKSTLDAVILVCRDEISRVKPPVGGCMC
jgi:hypothetical protein